MFWLQSWLFCRAVPRLCSFFLPSIFWVAPNNLYKRGVWDRTTPAPVLHILGLSVAFDTKAFAVMKVIYFQKIFREWLKKISYDVNNCGRFTDPMNKISRSDCRGCIWKTTQQCSLRSCMKAFFVSPSPAGKSSSFLAWYTQLFMPQPSHPPALNDSSLQHTHLMFWWEQIPFYYWNESFPFLFPFLYAFIYTVPEYAPLHKSSGWMSNLQWWNSGIGSYLKHLLTIFSLSG